MQCGNNLKQIGIGAHNFADSFPQEMFPPLISHSEGPTFFFHILPYIEQTNLYDLYDAGAKSGSAETTNLQSQMNWNYGIIVADPELGNQAVQGISTYHCPTYRSPDVRRDGNCRGAKGDYAITFTQGRAIDLRLDFSATEDGWWDHHDSTNNGRRNRQKGAIMTANGEGQPNQPSAPNTGGRDSRRISSRPVQGFRDITDGTANVSMAGEKFWHQGEWQLGCCNDNNVDGSVFVHTGGWREYLAARNMRFPLRVGVERRDTTGTNIGGGTWVEDNPDVNNAARAAGFGSWHGGIVQFVFCDGSVHSLNANVDIFLQHQICDRSDGITFDMP
jgi:hypothetical protein